MIAQIGEMGKQPAVNVQWDNCKSIAKVDATKPVPPKTQVPRNICAVVGVPRFVAAWFCNCLKWHWVFPQFTIPRAHLRNSPARAVSVIRADGPGGSRLSRPPCVTTTPPSSDSIAIDSIRRQSITDATSASLPIAAADRSIPPARLTQGGNCKTIAKVDATKRGLVLQLPQMALGISTIAQFHNSTIPQVAPCEKERRVVYFSRSKASGHGQKE